MASLPPGIIWHFEESKIISTNCAVYPESGLSIEIEYLPLLFLSITSDAQASPTL